MDNTERKELNTYQRLSDGARQRNKERATAYNREKTVRITVKAIKENFVDIENYMNECIMQGKSKSKNDFLLSAIRYAISKDFKRIEK